MKGKKAIKITKKKKKNAWNFDQIYSDDKIKGVVDPTKLLSGLSRQSNTKFSSVFSRKMHLVGGSYHHAIVWFFNQQHVMEQQWLIWKSFLYLSVLLLFLIIFCALFIISHYLFKLSLIILIIWIIFFGVW